MRCQQTRPNRVVMRACLYTTALLACACQPIDYTVLMHYSEVAVCSDLQGVPHNFTGALVIFELNDIVNQGAGAKNFGWGSGRFVFDASPGHLPPPGITPAASGVVLPHTTRAGQNEKFYVIIDESLDDLSNGDHRLNYQSRAGESVVPVKDPYVKRKFFDITCSPAMIEPL